MDKIRQHVAPGVNIVSQGEIVAASLKDYLLRHPDMQEACSKHGTRRFLTTDDVAAFEAHARAFFGAEVKGELCEL
jgi:glutamate racemase